MLAHLPFPPWLCVFEKQAEKAGSAMFFVFFFFNGSQLKTVINTEVSECVGFHSECYFQEYTESSFT